MMKFVLLVFFLATTARAFVPTTVTRRAPFVVLHAEAAASTEADVANQLDAIAHKLRLQCFDVDTGVYGFESKDPFYGIENIHTEISMDPSLGIELTEVAHSDLDHRGLVMVSKVSGNAAEGEHPVQVGDTIIGVFTQDGGFRESATAYDYDDTIDVIQRAKQYAFEHQDGKITLELNRVVKKAQVKVEIEDEHGQISSFDALAGDNLRLLLLKHHANLYTGRTPRLDQPNLTNDCGGEGICGTCLVAVRQGMSHLNKVGPQEQSILMKRPATWRAACKTVVGADNQEGTTLRIHLHPQTSDMENLRP